MNREILFEGSELLDLYQQHPDPLFPASQTGAEGSAVWAFHGRIPLSRWFEIRLPLPSIPVSFMGSPVTDLFPGADVDGAQADELVRAMTAAAEDAGSWAIIVKDLPTGHALEGALEQEGFVPIEHDPVWYRSVPEDVEALLRALSKGRRRGLEGRRRKFKRDVRVRPAKQDDIGFMTSSYHTLWARAGMRLEKLTSAFFSAALRHQNCRMLIFERDHRPFAFQMLWQRGDVWFDKYIGTDDQLSREYSFYTMSMLHVLEEAAERGIRWYVAGQGSGKDKAGLGFEAVSVNLWIKPLVLKRIAPALMERFSRMHANRIYRESEAGAP